MKNKMMGSSILLLVAVIIMSGVSVFRYEEGKKENSSGSTVINITSDDDEIFLGEIRSSVGDADRDLTVTSKDYILIRKHILKQYTIEGTGLKNADTNRDGKITVLDYIIVRKLLLGYYESSTVKPTAINLTTGNYVYTTLNKTVQLSVKEVLPKEVVPKEFLWISDNPSVALVNQSGLVTPISSGEARIYAMMFDGYNRWISGSSIFKIGEENIVDCKEGYYGDYKENKCSLCLKGFYCPGGKYDVSAIHQKELYEQKHIMDIGEGYESCPDAFTSNAGAKSLSECYIDIEVRNTQANKIMVTLKKYYNDTIGTLPTPTASGYYFVGWETSKNVMVKSPDQKVSDIFKGDYFTTNLYSVWSKNVTPTPTPKIVVTATPLPSNCTFRTYYEVIRTGLDAVCDSSVYGRRYNTKEECANAIVGKSQCVCMYSEETLCKGGTK